MKKVLVTGANGLLATNTIVELVENSYFVKALLRDKKKFTLPENNNIEIIKGDITDSESMELATKDCDFIIHVAAETRQGLSDYEDYSKINIDGTKTLIESAIKNNVKKIIHISTANVFGYGSSENPGNESRKVIKPFSDSLYVKSKIESQNLALSYSDKIEITFINPTFIIGAYDQKPSSGRIILMGYNKRFIFYPPGGKNFVDVKDVAKSILSAMTIGKNGESYIISGENLSYKEFFQKLANHSPIKPLLIKIPSFVLLSIGIIGNILKLLGIQNEITLTNMKILCIKNFYSNTKAKETLNIQFQAIDQAIANAIKWFKEKRIITQ